MQILTESLPGISIEVAMDYLPLQAFAASFSPHWLDGATSRRGKNSVDLPELCKDTLLSDNGTDVESQLCQCINVPMFTDDLGSKSAWGSQMKNFCEV